MGRVGEVFFRAFGELRASQRLAIPPVLDGKSILLACPTASGKTEALIAPLAARILARQSTADGVRLLAIAPTRALVNDLYARLNQSFVELGLSCGRQTSDHRSGTRLPFLLITTPESFDSLLARRTVFGQDGKPSGHALDAVEAVFIDEAHLFDNSSRGDQLRWLLARLRRLCCGSKRIGEPMQAIQVCAASATVSTPEALATRLLGPGSMVVSVPGARELLLYDDACSPHWSNVLEKDTLSEIHNRVLLMDSNASLGEIAAAIWRAMSSDQQPAIRKVLAFVPTRGLCDELSTVLRQYLTLRRNIAVFAHHGSLDKGVREAAEQGFSSLRDAVLVATSTLEVGVDIGDVDVVALIGPPPDTNGLLQRVGRTGRRLGITRVLAITRSPMDRFAMTSMLVAARDGRCDPSRYGRRWSVVVQQISSFVKQGASNGRRVRDITELGELAWPTGGGQGAKKVLDHLVQQGLLEAKGDRVRFGEKWQDLWDGMGMHGNIDGRSGGVPVVDALTGETLAHLPGGSRVPEQISMAGFNWRVTQARGEILLHGINVVGARGAIRYGSRKSPVGRAFARHVALGMGFTDRDLVLFSQGRERYVFHFGGSLFERLIVNLDSSLEPAPGLGGIALRGVLKSPLADRLCDAHRTDALLLACLREAPDLLAPGPFYDLLPAELQLLTLTELMPSSDFKEWIASRVMMEVEQGSEHAKHLEVMVD